MLQVHDDDVGGGHPRFHPTLTPPGHDRSRQKMMTNIVDVAFRIFDVTSSGRIDVPTFVIMSHSLGFRISDEDALRDLVDEMRERDMKDIPPVDDDRDVDVCRIDDDCRRRTSTIDAMMAKRMLIRRGYDVARTNVEGETRAYFDAFDVDDKGYITSDDLRRVRDEVCEEGAAAVGDHSLDAMIEQYDDDDDGVLNYREFGNVLGPLFRSTASRF